MLSFRNGLANLARACTSLASTTSAPPLASSSRAPWSASAFGGFARRTYATEYTGATGRGKQGVSGVQAALARQQPLYKTYKPVTPGLRHLRRPLAEHLWGGKPVRHLTVARRRHGGRNHHGRITVRFVGGGHRQRIRIIDYSRATPGPHDVVRIEYDPGRSAHIALIKSQDPAATATKKWTYILACEGMRAGDVVQSFRHGIPDNMIPGYVDSRGSRSKKAGAASGAEGALEMSAQEAEIEAAAERARASARSLAVGVLRSMTIKPGNVLPLRLIPPGTVIHNVALHPGGPGRLVRAAGTFAQVMLNEEGDRYAHVRLQSGEVRKVLKDCVASIGKVSNPLWKNRSLGKAGRSRWLGRRPHVRGMAMNACDHPHGGGRGKNKGNKDPRSVWGWLTKGKRTRKPGPKGPKNSNKMVIRERPRGKQTRAN